MRANDQHSERVLIYDPTGRDAEIAQQILNAAGLSSEPVGSFPALCLEISRGAGLVVIAEEAIQTAVSAPPTACHFALDASRVRRRR